MASSSERERAARAARDAFGKLDRLRAPGARGRFNPRSEPTDAIIDRKLLANLRRDPPGKPDAVGQAALDKAKGGRPTDSHGQSSGDSGSSASGSGSGSPTDDFGAKLVSRLAALERAHASLSAECEALRVDNAALRRRLSSSGSTGDAEGPGGPPAPRGSTCQGGDAVFWHAEAQAAKRTVAEMQRFLADYGMRWVGGGGGVSDQIKSAGKAEGPEVSGAKDPLVAAALARAPADGGGGGSSGVDTRGYTRCPLDMGKLAASVSELNAMAGEGKAEVGAGGRPGEARLREGETLVLCVYADGFSLGAGRLRPWHEKATRAFMRDMLDGYFPYELKESHPDGVAFKLVDSSDMAFADAAKAAKDVAAKRGNVRGLASLEEAPMQLGRTQYLSKLPEAVIRNGKVVNVRAEVAALMGKGDGAKVVADGAGAPCVPMEEYLKVHVKLSLVLIPDITLEEALSSGEEDWAEDAKGQPSMSQDDLYDCLFQLADMWCTGIDGDEYAVIVAVSADAPEKGLPNAETLRLQPSGNGLATAAILDALAARGLRRILVEGGARTIARFIEERQVDRLHVAISPLIIGAGPSGINLVPVARLADARRPSAAVYNLGSDILFDCPLSDRQGQ